MLRKAIEGLKQGSLPHSNCLLCCGEEVVEVKARRPLWRGFAAALTRTGGGVPQKGGTEVEKRGQIQDVCGR